MRIRRGLSSRHLPCGCIAGVYETYRDEIVAILDVRNPQCENPAHASGNVLPDMRPATGASFTEKAPRD